MNWSLIILTSAITVFCILLMNKVRAEYYFAMARKMMRQGYTSCVASSHTRLSAEDVYLEFARLKVKPTRRQQFYFTVFIVVRGWV